MPVRRGPARGARYGGCVSFATHPVRVRASGGGPGEGRTPAGRGAARQPDGGPDGGRNTVRRHPRQGGCDISGPAGAEYYSGPERAPALKADGRSSSCGG
ncbi:hypothetical protein GCM10009802_11060 [Streptomyces synnematoformans]|uniref:Uncharacterized protein n=1 Tax=Streptomyces synnematoformans TaxID=415721 RepID=A0ABN2XLQ0_9ACTN